MDENNEEQRAKALQFYNYMDNNKAINPTGSEGILSNPEVLKHVS